MMMYLIMQKIRVALSSLELKVFIVMGEASYSCFCCYGDEKSVALSVVTRALFLVFVTVQNG